MRTIAIVNQKGGCGKTITAINLSAFLASAGRRVLLIDIDPQGHATLGLLKDSSRLLKTIYDVLTVEQEPTGLAEVIVTLRDNLDLLPADIMLAALPEELAGTPGQESRLSRALETIRQQYDYIIIDCPPSVGPLTFNALRACTEVIIPVEPSFFSLHGIGMQLETLEMMAQKIGHNIRPRALITLYRSRYDFVKAVTQEIRRHLGERLLNTVIRFSIKLSEAAGHALPIADFSPRSAGYADYSALAREILQDESVAAEPEEFRPKLQASPPFCMGEGVLFTLKAPDAHCVQLAGDFNDWIPEGNEMQSNGCVWAKVEPLPPGRYQYRYVVDGTWLPDPLNVAVEPSPWGGYNSVFVHDGAGSRNGAQDNL
jgi:chromosome partitioning protein